MGLAAAAGGDTLEFWGAWLAGEPTARAAAAGEAVWWGSDPGWTVFLFGVTALFFGGPTAAVGLGRDTGLPLWALGLFTLLGLGVLFVHLVVDSPPAGAALGLGPFALGWVALGTLCWREPRRLAQRTPP